MGLLTDTLLSAWAIGVNNPDAVEWTTPTTPFEPPEDVRPGRDGREGGMIMRGNFVGGTPHCGYSPIRLRAPELPADPAFADRLWDLLPETTIDVSTPMFASQDWQEPARFPVLEREDPTTLPPVKLVKSCDQLWIVDGHHRLTSARARAHLAGMQLSVPAKVWDQDQARNVEQRLRPHLPTYAHPDDWLCGWS